MSAPQDCCNPCSTQVLPPVNIPGTPGPAGPPGTNGTDGINAFTFVTAPGFLVPALGANVTVPTANSLWETVGQNVEVEGAGTFQVVSKSLDGLSTVLKYLDGYVHNTNTGNSIPAGAQISPSGTQPSFLPGQSFYAVGGSQNLTASAAQLLSSQVTLPANGKYLISSSVRVDFESATTLANKNVSLKLRETTNGPADLANAVRSLELGIVTNADETIDVPPLPSVIYTGATGDTIQMFGNLDVTLTNPYESGNVQIVEVTILAIPIA